MQGSQDTGDAAPPGASGPAADGGIDAPGAGGVGGVEGGVDGSIPLPTPDAGVVANPGNVDDATKAKIRAGGNADPSFAWLYPYDGTVLPLGLPAPLMQWSGDAADAIYVHAATNGLSYEGFYGPGAPGAPSAALDASTWDALTASAAPSGTMVVEVTILRGGAVTGPRREAWTIANAKLPGALYYAALGAPALNGNGAVMKVDFGAPATIAVGQTTCMGCHGVSADGSTMIASYGDNNSGALFDLRSGVTHVRDESDSLFTWGALSPDGALLLSNGALDGGFPPNVSGQTQGPRPSRLYDTKSGALLAAPGWDERITAALMPVFAPDGTRVAFNHYDAGQGKSLSAMRFDGASRSFSDFVDIAIDSSRFLGWPSFTPDGAHVVFQAGSRDDYVTEQLGKGDLLITSSTAQAVVALDALNGGSSMPSRDAHLSFWPSVAPVAAGGYAWVAFTSRRPYGSANLAAAEDSDERQKIWISALDVNVAPGKDPSHPAFYLPGQETASGNMRPQWVAK